MVRATSFRRVRFLAATALGLASAAGLAHNAHASGFGLREGAADWLGNAFVGSEAKAYDASTAWTNPAGMALLDQSQFSGNVSYIGPSAKFTGRNTNPLYPALRAYGASRYLSGGNGGNAVSPAASGALFAVFVLNPDWRLGFSITNPYGERTSYSKDWVGRYQGLVSSITAVDFSTALSYKVNNHLSIGAGPVVEYFHARLTQGLNTPALVLQATHGQYYNPLLGDAAADIHGSDVAVGYNIGVLYKFDDATRIGLDYHSRIRHDISGTEAINSPVSAMNTTVSARTTVTLPDSLGVSIYHQVTPAWALMGSVQWTHWSLFNSMHVTPAAGTSTVINENWRNSWFAGVGTNYQVNDRLMLQAGFSFDESPVTDSNRTPRVPDANHYDLGIGAHYKITPATTFELAYAHVFSPGGSVNSSANAAAGTLIGNYDASDNSVTAGVNVVF